MSRWCKGVVLLEVKLSNLEKEPEKKYIYEEPQELLKSKMEQFALNFEEETDYTGEEFGEQQESVCTC